MKLLAAINKRTGAVAYGRYRDEIVALACDTETVDRLVDFVLHRAPPIRKLEFMIQACRDELSAPLLSTKPAPSRRECDYCGGGGWVTDDAGDAIRCAKCNIGPAGPCETDPGGVR